MRGKPFHNLIVSRVKTILQGFFRCVYLEYRFRRNGAVTDFDVFAQKALFALAIEVETTCRHGIDNARKAAAVDVPLWIIVPTQTLRAKLSRQLRLLELRPGDEPIKIFLLGQLEQEVMNYLSLFIVANKQKDKQ